MAKDPRGHAQGGEGGCAPSPKNCDGHSQKGHVVAECPVAGGSVVRRVPLGPLGAALPRVVGDRRLGLVSLPRLPKNQGGRFHGVPVPV